ncbi:MAG: ATP-binding protein [Clostridia bacterium]
MYAKNILYLREQEQRDKVQIAQLQQQYAYYQDKLKDEERIRSIYHDMKNHLLVLESKQNTEETRQMAQELRTQIADYENYIHTGNEFLDIILKDKSEKAREKHIDFSAIVDFEGVDFIEPLDISTLFGNGIDNAIEACEKLREEDRVILVRAGKVQNFVSILIENNCTVEVLPKGKRTTKADSLLHGFGLSNMQKAAEKYGGTCTTKQVDGKFILKILLPVSAGKAVD